MKTIQYKILNKMGFHVRPSSCLAAMVRDSQSIVCLYYKDKVIKANRFVEVANLNITCGEIVRFTIEGKDEDKLMNVIQLFCIEELS